MDDLYQEFRLLSIAIKGFLPKLLGILDDSNKIALRDKDLTEFLKVENVSDLFSFEMSYDKEFQYLDGAYHINKFFDSKFNATKITSYTFDRKTRNQPSYEKLKESYNTKQFTKVPHSLYKFYIMDNLRLVIEYNYPDIDGYSIYVHKNDEDKLTKLLEEFDVFYAENNLYKNKKIEFKTYEAFKILPESTRKFDTIKLYDGFLEEIQENVLDILLKPEKYKKFNIPLKRGVLFSGIPGGGKTSSVDAICSELAGKVTIFMVSAVSIHSTIDIESLYTTARRLAPSLIVFEDVDLLGGNRDVGEYSNLVGELLNQLDGSEPNDMIVTVATTNHPDRLDSALSKRPSRFDRHLKFELPNQELRLEILKQYLSAYKITEELENSLKSISHDLRECSGARIKEVVITAALIAMRRSKDIVILTKDDIESSLSRLDSNFGEKGSDFKGFA